MPLLSDPQERQCTLLGSIRLGVGALAFYSTVRSINENQRLDQITRFVLH